MYMHLNQGACKSGLTLEAFSPLKCEGARCDGLCWERLLIHSAATTKDRLHGLSRRGAGVVERGGLENRCAGNSTQSSNLCLSARYAGHHFAAGVWRQVTLERPDWICVGALLGAGPALKKTRCARLTISACGPGFRAVLVLPETERRRLSPCSQTAIELRSERGCMLSLLT
jgi:hypothetical protein